jgi:type II secretory pathway component PulF
MPLFHWQALTAAGEPMEAVEPGESEVQLIEALRRRGLRVTRVQRELPVAAVTRARPVAPAVLRLLQELATLRGLGFSVPGALAQLAADPSRERGGLAGELLLVRQAVEAGQPLGEALARVPQRFDGLVCRVLAAGESRGDLDGALRQLTRHLEAIERPDPLASALRRLGWTALASFAALVLALAMLTPLTGGLLARLAVTPSPVGAGLLAFAAALAPLLPWLAAGVALLGLAGVAALRSSRLRTHLDALLLRLPGLGPALRLHGLLRLARLLALLLAVELPLWTALELAAPRLGNDALAGALSRARAQVAQGLDLAGAMAEGGLLTPLGVAMLRSADLGAALPALASRCEAEAEVLARRARRLARALGLVTGALVVTGALALLWPLRR